MICFDGFIGSMQSLTSLALFTTTKLLTQLVGSVTLTVTLGCIGLFNSAHLYFFNARCLCLGAAIEGETDGSVVILLSFSKECNLSNTLENHVLYLNVFPLCCMLRRLKRLRHQF